MARANYRNADVDLMARMMRAEAEGEGKQGMLYVGNVIVNRLVANCLDFRDLRTIEDVIFQIQGEITRSKRCKKAICSIKERGKRRDGSPGRRWIIGGNTRRNMLFGISTHTHHARPPGTANRLPANSKAIAFMNPPRTLVKGCI